MTRTLRLGTVLLMLHLAASAFEDSTPFAALKALQGQWAIQAAGKTLAIRMTYEIGSNGSIVEERFGKELSVFYQDGPQLAMIHFCNRGNQPRLKLNAEKSSPTVLDFEAVAVTNLPAPDAPHVQRIVYTLLDNNSMKLEIVWQRAKSQDSEIYRLDRI